MKILNFLNLSLITSILANLLLGLINDSYFTNALVLTLFAMPLFQLIVGFVWLIGYKENKRIQFYFYAVITYFFVLYSSVLWWDAAEKITFLKIILGFLFFATPISLAIYFTVILYKFSKEFSFMKAEWKNLIIINYQINPKFLEKYIPKGTEIELYNGKCYISLVGFMFENVKLLGVKIPYHVNFEEVNLRFYVKRFEDGKWKRGVVFIKELVPKPALTFVANTVYKEHYQTLPMKHSVSKNTNSNGYVYQWKTNDKWNSILIETEKIETDIALNSEAEFITEHYFGYTKITDSKTFEYEVKHPRWQQLKVINHEIDIDFKATYGPEFDFLKNNKPTSILFTKGSKISVENKRKIS